MRRLISATAGLLFVLFSTSAQQAQVATEFYIPTVIEANQSRPLVVVLGRLQEIYRTAINYEEVAYENPNDLESQDLRTSTGVLHRSFPKRGSLKVTIGQNEISSPYLGLQAALLAQINSGLGGVYELAQGPSDLTVYPAQVLAANGTLKRVTPLMSQGISFPKSQRTAGATLNVILAQLSAVTGAKLITGSVDLPEDREITLGASAEPAKDVLRRLTAESFRGPTSYWLLYDPGQKAYYLSLRSVPGFVPSALNISGKQPSKQPTQKQTNTFFTKDK